jgi:hypothetical protein
MVDKTTKDDTTTRTTTNNVRDVYDTVRENLVRVQDEMAKVQPQLSQSLSNLQQDYIQTTAAIFCVVLAFPPGGPAPIIMASLTSSGYCVMTACTT